MQKQFDYVFKIVIVGSSSVGKSSILKRFADGDYTSKYISTIGVDFRFKSFDLDGKSIKLQVWDTAGQERFKSLAYSYYKDAHAVILVYDIKNPASFEEIQKYWLTELKENMKNFENLFIVANKCDNQDENPCIFQTQYLQSRSIKYYRTSAKTGTNIHQLFDQITKHLLTKYPTMQKKSYQTIILKEQMREQQIKQKRCCK